jgi:hypothetical protein
MGNCVPAPDAVDDELAMLNQGSPTDDAALWRRTNRLRDTLLLYGFGLYTKLELTLFHPLELELVKSRNTDQEGAIATDTQVIAPPLSFDLKKLDHWLKRGKVGSLGLTIRPFQTDLHRSQFAQENSQGRPIHDRSVAILWISATEFISAVRISHFGVHSVGVFWSDDLGHVVATKLYATSLLNFYGDKVSRGPLPMKTFGFLRELIYSTMSQILKIELGISERDVPSKTFDAMLSLLPTNARKCERQGYLQVVFRLRTSLGAEQSLQSYPFHRSIVLRLSEVLPIDLKQLNALFRHVQHLRHIHVQRSLVDLQLDALDDDPFTANPVLESIVLEPKGRVLSQALLDGVARSTSIRHLTLTSAGEARQDAPNFCEVLCRAVQGKFSNLETLTIALNSQSTAPQSAFSAMTYLIPAQLNKKTWSGFGVACVRFTLWNSLQPPVVRSNRIWDSHVVPVLAKNWFNRHLQKQSSSTAGESGVFDSRLIRLAIRAVNQGIVFGKTTNVVPSDMAFSNAILIFHLIKESVKYRSR